MSDRESQSLGRILALVLRHAPEKFGVDMDTVSYTHLTLPTKRSV